MPLQKLRPKGAMRQLVGTRGLWEPHHTHYSLQFGDKGGEVKKAPPYSTNVSHTLGSPAWDPGSIS